MNNMPKLLPKTVVNSIREFINLNKERLSVDPLSDKPLGQGVFRLIAKECDLLYYPIIDLDEKNNGCLIPHLPLKSGEERNVIFINTYQTAEKQVFAAAHEFGHHLGVDRFVQQKHHNADAERIVNRFAAEWIMPESQFKKHVKRELNKQKTGKSIKLIDMIQIIVECMDAFTVPYNAAVIRMVEVGFLDINSGRLLVDGDDKLVPLALLEIIREKMIAEKENSVLQTRSLRKEYVGLSELLDKETVIEKLPLNKVQRVRDWFDILKSEQSAELKRPISLKDEEE